MSDLEIIQQDDVVVIPSTEDTVSVVQAEVGEVSVASEYDFSLFTQRFEELTTEMTDLVQAQIDTITTDLTTRMNTVEGEIADVSDLIDTALGNLIETGTKMVFWQAAAPTGWTKQTTHNDKALRVVSGAGGGYAGTTAFSTVFSRTSVDSHAIDGNELTYHAHTFSDYYQISTYSPSSFTYAGGSTNWSYTMTESWGLHFRRHFLCRCQLRPHSRRRDACAISRRFNL